MSLSVGCCSYVGCTNTYATDKDISYFKFPDDIPRRTKWINNCGDLSLLNLGERQLRHKRICAAHFPKSYFVNPEYKNALLPKAVPIHFTEKMPEDESKKESQSSEKKRQKARRSTNATSSTTIVVVKVEQDVSQNEGQSQSPSRKSPSKTFSEKKSSGLLKSDVNLTRKSLRGGKVSILAKSSSNENKEEESEDRLGSPRRTRGRGSSKIQPGSSISLSKTQLSSISPSKQEPNETNRSTRRTSYPVSSLGKQHNLSPTKVATVTLEDCFSSPRLRDRPKRVYGRSSANQTKVIEKVAEPLVRVVPLTEKPTIKVQKNVESDQSNQSDKTKKRKLATEEKKDPMKSSEGFPSEAKKMKSIDESKKSTATLQHQLKSTSSPEKQNSSVVEKAVKTFEKEVYNRDAGSISPVQKVAIIKSTEKDPKVSRRIIIKEDVPKQSFSTPSSSSTITKPKTTNPSVLESNEKNVLLGAKKIIQISRDTYKPRHPREKPIPSRSDPTVTKVSLAEIGRQVMEGTVRKISLPSKEQMQKAKLKSRTTSAELTLSKEKTNEASTTSSVGQAVINSIAKAAASSGTSKSSAKPGVKTYVKVLVTTGNKVEEIKLVEVNNPDDLPKIAKAVAQVDLKNFGTGKFSVKQLKLGESAAFKGKKLGNTFAKLPSVPNLKDLPDAMSSKGSTVEEFENDEEFDNLSVESDQKDNREFERFHVLLKQSLGLAENWGLGGVLWNPTCNMKVTIASEMDMINGGDARVKRAVEIFEDGSLKMFVAGVDVTRKFDVKEKNDEHDVAAMISKLSECHLCVGVPSFKINDLLRFPSTKKRTNAYFSENCETISLNSSTVEPFLCSSCKNLDNSLKDREAEQCSRRRNKDAVEHHINEFGREFYSLLGELLEEVHGRFRPRRKLNTYSKFVDDDLRIEDEEDDDEDDDDEFNSVPPNFQEVISKLGLKASCISAASNANSKREGGMYCEELVQVNSPHGNIVVPKAPDFALTDGEEYELIGEVDPNEVKVLELVKPTEENIEIIEFDEDTMSQLTISGENVGATISLKDGPIQTAEVDASDPKASPFLKMFIES